MARTSRRRKLPVTLTNTERDGSSSSSSSSTPRASRAVIRRFHTLLKQQKRARGDDAGGGDDALANDNISREIEALGGLGRYQRMSCIGQGSDRGGGSEKVLIGWLKQKQKQTMVGCARDADGNGRENLKAKRRRLLEVGAVRPDNYRGCESWVDVTAIDLRSRHPSILEQDFLLMDLSEHRGTWDIVSLSLVLNFVPDGKDRGRMLVHAHSMLREGGLCFLALPFPCVDNSRYMTMDHMKEIMGAIGFSQLEERWKPGGKMAYWLYRKQAPPESSARERFGRKAVLRQGGHRNNFHIILDLSGREDPQR